MTYRDERDALRGRVDQLQQELDEAKQKASEGDPEAVRKRAEALETELAGVEEHLAAIRKDVRELRPARRSSGGPRVFFVVVASAVVGGALYLTLARRPPAMPEAPTVVELPAPVQPTPPPPAPAPVEPPAEPKPVAAPAKSEPRDVMVRWTATVKKATGVAVAPGAACTVEAKLATTGTNVTVPHLVLACGKTKLYDSDDALEGMAQMDNDARQILGPKDDATSYSIQYRDVGPRTGARAQIDLDSTKGKAIAFREGLEAMRVELALPLGAPAKPIEEVFRREGTVASVTGAAPTKVGARCAVRAAATGQQDNCEAELLCGGKAVTPAPLAPRCRFDGGRLAHLAAGGEAGFDMDADATTLELGDEKKTWTVKIDLAPRAAP